MFFSRYLQVIGRFLFNTYILSAAISILISMAITFTELPYWLYRINALVRKLNPLLIHRCFSLPRIDVFNLLTRAQSRVKYFIFLSQAQECRIKYFQILKTRRCLLTTVFVIFSHRHVSNKYFRFRSNIFTKPYRVTERDSI